MENEGWIAGQYRGSYDDLISIAKESTSTSLPPRAFEDTLTDELLGELQEYVPILIWMDCDYYTSLKRVFERHTPFISTGCVIYFDDIPHNFGSRFTGEMRAVWEINQGAFGDGVELVLDRELSWDTNRVYRFVNLEAKVQHRRRLRVFRPPPGAPPPRRFAVSMMPSGG